MEKEDRQTQQNLKPNDSAVYRPGQSPEMDAWFTSFFIENHLDYFTYPDHAASTEQIRFMVYTEPSERYYPCSDRMFEAIMTRKHSAFLQKNYQQVLHKILKLIDHKIEDPYEKSYLESLIITKYQHETRDEIMIPSRLEKRLMKIFIKRTQIEDPYMDEKILRNRKAASVLESQAFQRALNLMDPSELDDLPETISDMKNLLAFMELKRLIAISATAAIWESDTPSNDEKIDYRSLFNQPVSGNGMQAFFEFLGIHGNQHAAPKPKKILWLADESGEIMVDLAVIDRLTALGHKIIVAFKEGPLFTKTDFYDTQDDDSLRSALEHTQSINEKNLNKNQLVNMLRSDRKVFVISDGTSEASNLLLASTTFARAFKEVDGVISRGHDQRSRFFEVRFQFTQDIFSIAGRRPGRGIHSL